MAAIPFNPSTGTFGTPDNQSIVPSVAPAQPVQKKSLVDSVVGAGKAVGDFFTGSEQGLGKNIADIIGADAAREAAVKQADQEHQFITTLIGLKRKAIAEGKDSSHFDKLLADYQPQGYQAPELPTVGETALNLAGTAADVLSAGTYGAAKTAAMKSGELAIKAAPTFATLAAKGVEAGLNTAKNVATTAAENAAKKEAAKVINVLAPAAENLSTAAKKEAIDAGRQSIMKTATGGTKVSYGASPEIERAAKILTDPKILKTPLTAKDAPNLILAKTKAVISHLGQKAENYLEKNVVKIKNAEDANLFSALRTAAEKSSTETELKAYDEQVKLFQKQLLGRPGGYTTANYYKALKQWEENIASKLPRGKTALLDPTGVASAKIRAAADIRKAVRDLIGAKHPEFKGRMYDIASLYEAKEAALLNAVKTESASILEKHPKLVKAVKAAALGGGILAGGGAVTGAIKSTLP